LRDPLRDFITFGYIGVEHWAKEMWPQHWVTKLPDPIVKVKVWNIMTEYTRGSLTKDTCSPGYDKDQWGAKNGLITMRPFLKCKSIYCKGEAFGCLA